MENKINKKPLYLHIQSALNETMAVLFGAKATLRTEYPEEFTNVLQAIFKAQDFLLNEIGYFIQQMNKEEG